MRTRSRFIGVLIGSALIASAATPAAARGWDWGGRGHRHYDRGRDAGAVIGAIAAVGIIAAIASSASKKRQVEVERRYEPAPPYSGPDDRYDEAGPQDDGASYDGRAVGPRYDDGREGGIVSGQDAAVDGCVLAARDRASGNGDYAEIRGVTNVSPRGSGWDVSGQVEQRASYRATESWSRNFSCSWQDGRVSAVSLD